MRSLFKQIGIVMQLSGHRSDPSVGIKSQQNLNQSWMEATVDSQINVTPHVKFTCFYHKMCCAADSISQQ